MTSRSVRRRLERRRTGGEPPARQVLVEVVNLPPHISESFLIMTGDVRSINLTGYVLRDLTVERISIPVTIRVRLV